MRSALQCFGLEHGWHDVRFVLENGRGVVDDLLDRCATACKRIA
jgi:hypothetical protein